MELDVRRLAEVDLPAADHLFRLAFGTFLGLPDPLTFTGDAALVETRWRANADWSLGAYDGGTLVGSSFATCWGRFGFVGPISVHPELWNKGIAKRLLEGTIGILERSNVVQSALVTFPQSPKHIGLYQTFGFWPRYLTPIMSKPVRKQAAGGGWVRYSTLGDQARAERLAGCARLTGRLFAGLDVAPEIVAIHTQGLGDTILIEDSEGVAAFAACHVGKGSEAGSDTLFVKFAAARPGDDAPRLFGRLLDGCEWLAATADCREMVAGVNAARHHAYRQMIDRGFRTLMEGVAMLRPNDPAFNRPDCFVIDDLR